MASDWALEEFGPRAFEQLAVALAAKVISPHIEVYGSGKDGGREGISKSRKRYVEGSRWWRGCETARWLGAAGRWVGLKVKPLKRLLNSSASRQARKDLPMNCCR